MSLPRKVMKQCRLSPAKLWSNADFAPQNHKAFALCPAKSRRPCSLPRKIMDQCRLCPAKLGRHSLRGQKYHKIKFSYLLIHFFFVNHCYFRDLYNPFGPLFKEKMSCVTVPLKGDAHFRLGFCKYSNFESG